MEAHQAFPHQGIRGQQLNPPRQWIMIPYWTQKHGWRERNGNELGEVDDCGSNGTICVIATPMLKVVWSSAGRVGRWRGGVGAAYLLPALTSDGASLVTFRYVDGSHFELASLALRCPSLCPRIMATGLLCAFCD